MQDTFHSFLRSPKYVCNTHGTCDARKSLYEVSRKAWWVRTLHSPTPPLPQVSAGLEREGEPRPRHLSSEGDRVQAAYRARVGDLESYCDSAGQNRTGSPVHVTPRRWVLRRGAETSLLPNLSLRFHALWSSEGPVRHQNAQGAGQCGRYANLSGQFLSILQ